MNDLISRQAAIAVADSSDYVGLSVDDVKKVTDEVVKGLKRLPSAQPNEFRKQGEWDMFELITSAWYGKQYYFKEENGMAYSRKSHKAMTVHDAILEFIREIGDE